MSAMWPRGMIEAAQRGANGNLYILPGERISVPELYRLVKESTARAAVPSFSRQESRYLPPHAQRCIPACGAEKSS